MTREELKQWIDEQSYEGLVAQLKIISSSDLLLEGSMKEYYANALREKKFAQLGLNKNGDIPSSWKEIFKLIWFWKAWWRKK